MDEHIAEYIEDLKRDRYELRAEVSKLKELIMDHVATHTCTPGVTSLGAVCARPEGNKKVDPLVGKYRSGARWSVDTAWLIFAGVLLAAAACALLAMWV